MMTDSYVTPYLIWHIVRVEMRFGISILILKTKIFPWIYFPW